MAQDLGSRPWYNDWPEGVPKMIDIPDIGLGDLLRDTAKQYPDNKAIIFLDSVMSYRELDDYVDRLATAFDQMGIKKGDVVAMMLPNSPQFVITFYACQRIGVTTTAINPTYKPLEIKHQLNDSGAKAFVVLDSVYEAAGKVLDQTKVKHLIGTNIVDLVKLSPIKKFLGKLLKKIPTGQMPANALKFTDLLKTAPNPPKVTINPAEDVAVLQYTGGTTGTPKGGMLTARNLVSNALMGKAWIGGKFPSDGGYVGVLPLFHVFAMTCVMNIAVANGCFQLLFPKPPDSMLDWAAQVEKWGKGTQLIMPGVAVLFNKINNTPGIEKFDLSPLVKCLSGAGPLPREVQLTFEKKIGALVVEGYGLTESSPVTHANPFVLRPGVERVMGSIGLPFPNTDVKIMDLETGTQQMPYGPEGVGELCVKGPQVMKGYFNRPEESARTLRDGWLYTGDIGYFDEDEYLFIVDRKKEMILVGGFNVYPREVDELLMKHPAIHEAATVGVPDSFSGEAVKAYVALKPGAALTREALEAYCEANLVKYKRPKHIEFLAALPKTSVGKLDKLALKRM